MSAPAAVLAPWAATLPSGIDTPSVVVDGHTVEANLARMAAVALDGDALLRPHAKTHKIPVLGRRQLALGAVGLTVATLGEAAVFADGGCDDLFVAFPLWAGGPKSVPLRAVRERTRLRVGVDSAEAAAWLARATVGTAPLEVMVEIDSGGHRSGVRPDAAGGIAVSAERLGLQVRGAFTFAGQIYDGPQARGDALRAERDGLDAAAASMAAAGVPCEILSGGSTPSAASLAERSAARRAPRPRRGDDSECRLEIRPGSYVFNDRMQVELGAAGPGDVALVVAATVVSVSDDHFVIDAGSKVLSSDRPEWLTGFGCVVGYRDAGIVRLSEHHGVVELTTGADRPALGDVVAVVPNHVCNVVNLADEVVVVRDGDLPAERWTVAAAGRNR